MIRTLSEILVGNFKNIHGQPTIKDRVVVFSVDDYGNVRLDSKKARENMGKAGLKVLSRFDALDSLETPDDLTMLFECLRSFKDQHGNHPCFTAFSLPCNIDFEGLAANNYEQYVYETLPVTFSKLKGYENTWEIWRQGIADNLIRPEFHGREHFNLRVFNEKLSKRDQELMIALQNRSYTCISSSGYQTISYTAAFEFWDFSDNKKFEDVIVSGLAEFREVFGRSAVHFNPPGGREHRVLYKTLSKEGIMYLDTPWVKSEHQGKGRYMKVINQTGEMTEWGQRLMLRNVVFEPNHKKEFDWVGNTLKQIERAFRWNKPAIISSHRVNFCGNIDQSNRRDGIQALKRLLTEILKRWPDVRFMSATDFMKSLYD